MNLSAYIPYCLALIMFSMGLSLQVADFKRILLYPKAIMLGVFCQIIILPVLAWSLAQLTDLNPTMTAGLVLLALCPGGVTSNLASHLAGGNGALSVSLTAVSSIITVFTLPLIMSYLLTSYAITASGFNLPLLPAIQQLAMLTLVPLAVGMSCRHWFTVPAQQLEKPIATLSALLFCLIIASVWWQQWSNIQFSAQQTGLAALGLNVIGLLIGWGLARANNLPLKDQTTLSLEVGLQNSALAVVVALNMIGNGQLAIPASVYSVVMVCTAVSVIIGSRWHTKTVG